MVNNTSRLKEEGIEPAWGREYDLDELSYIKGQYHDSFWLEKKNRSNQF